MVEIERKFKLKSGYTLCDIIDDRSNSTPIMMAALYLEWNDNNCSRIRVEEFPDTLKCIHTHKQEVTPLQRIETETIYSLIETLKIFNQSDHTPIYKKRYVVPYEGAYFLKWEIDVFSHTDLIIIEIELPNEDYDIHLPEWVGEEITTDYEYTNLQMFLKLNGLS